MACYRSGGCGPYEMLSCNECPASKPDYLEKRGGTKMERYGDMKNREGYSDPTAGTALRKAQSAKIQRGDIYYIDIPYATGHEMEKDRPGIVVSCDALNETSPCVNVVFCSASSKRELPEHITIRSTPLPSTALCEHIYTVDKSRIGKLVGRATAAEMDMVNIGIMSGLNLGTVELASPCVPVLEERQSNSTGETDGSLLDLVRAQAERDTYKGLYERLLDRMSIERRIGA